MSDFQRKSMLMVAAACAAATSCADGGPASGLVSTAEQRQELGVATAPWQMKTAPLMTRWAEYVSNNTANPLPEYPRPQMVRSRWLNLNGIWQFQAGQSADPVPVGRDLASSILVPYPIESALSGVMEPNHEYAWYRRTFVVPYGWARQRVMINFGAVDWHTEVYVNGQKVGDHKGGYDPFSIDITNALKRWGASEELIVRIYDPTDNGLHHQPFGKQTLTPYPTKQISYTASSGIWQTVWLEPVSSMHIGSLKIVPDVDAGRVKITATRAGAAVAHTVSVTVKDGTTVVATGAGQLGDEITLSIPSPKLWSPERPFLYNLEVSVRNGTISYDSITSYFGMRKIHVAEENGFRRIFLNNQPIFQMGPLDQGFWPDGLYTAPTDEALKSDLETAKQLGFNMVRKHIKVEPQRWYYHADTLGLLVWQDMPSAEGLGWDSPAEQKAQFETELRAMIANLGNTTSIVTWIPFNEAWGQFDTERFVGIIKELDPSRLVTPASGWSDAEAGDIKDEHIYPVPACPTSQTRATVSGEYGGLGLRTDATHMWGGAWSQYEVPDAQSLTDMYDKLATAGARCKTWNGLSGLVYTQLTDVEGEINGLMTYDRELVKPDVARVAAANQAVISGVATVRDVMSSSRAAGRSWSYLTGDSRASAPPNWQDPSYQEEDEEDNSGRHWASGPGGFGNASTPGAVVRSPWNQGAIWLRQWFTLPAMTPQRLDNLFYEFHNDDDLWIYLNGVQDMFFNWDVSDYISWPLGLPGRSALQQGSENLIAVQCTQDGGPQHVDVGISEVVRGEPSSFADDFDDGNADGWTTVGGEWSVDAGEYGVGTGEGYKSIAGGTYFKNLTYQADVSVGDWNNAGLIFRVTRPSVGMDSYNGYYVGINAGEQLVELGKATAAGSWTQLDTAPVAITPRTRHHLKVFAFENAIHVYVDDMATPKIDIIDSSYKAGAVGVRSFFTDARFDNVQVTKH